MAGGHGSSSEHFVPDVIFGLDPMITATGVLCVAYAFIISEKINRAVISLLGAGMMIFLGVLNQHTAVQGIDFNTIFLLIGMMAIVGVTKRSGVFQFVAILSAKMVRGNPRMLMTVLAIITAAQESPQTFTAVRHMSSKRSNIKIIAIASYPISTPT